MVVVALLAFFAFGTVTGAVIDDTSAPVHKVVEKVIGN